MTEGTLTNAPICATQKCKRPLTFLGPPQNCWRCLVCNPIREVKPTEKPKKKYVDVTMTEDMVIEIIKEQVGSAKVSAGLNEEQIREIVQDELANWHIQEPPITRDEVAEAVGVGEPESNVHINVQLPTDSNYPSTDEPKESFVAPKVKPETWLQKAKRIGVRTHNEGTGGMRKKVEIMADMEAKERESDAQIPEELRTEEQAGSSGSQRPPVDNNDAETTRR